MSSADGLLIDFLYHNTGYPDSYGTSLIAHIGFFSINLFLVIYDITFEMFIFDRLRKNKLTVLAFIASLSQAISCSTSIWRYNISYPYGALGVAGTIFGEIGMFLMNVRCIITITNIYNKPRYTKPVIIATALITVINFIIFYLTYEEQHFLQFQYYVLFTSLVGFITSIVLFIKFRKHGNNQNDDIQYKSIIVSIVLYIIAAIFMLSPFAILIYPGNGIVYVNNQILAIHTGSQSQNKYDEYCKTSSNEEDEQVEDEQVEQVQQEILQFDDEDEISFGKRIKLLIKPILLNDLSGSRAKITIIPTAIRIWFYLYFMIYFGSAYLVSLLPGSELDFNDNIVLNTFGYNNICVVVDYPPWTLFGTTLWIPALLCLLFYTYFDYLCIKHDYIDGIISKKFYTFYTITSVFEMFAFSFFTQITATPPTQSAIIHTIPFLIGTFALWTMSFKHHLYLDKVVGVFNNKMRIFGIIYQILLILVCIFKSATDLPNLLLPVDGKLFMLNGWKWTLKATQINDRLFLLLVLILPLIFEYIFVIRLKVLNFVIKSKFIFKSLSSTTNNSENENLMKITTQINTIKL